MSTKNTNNDELKVPPSPPTENQLTQVTKFLLAVAGVLTALAEVLQWLNHSK